MGLVPHRDYNIASPGRPNLAGKAPGPSMQNLYQIIPKAAARYEKRAVRILMDQPSVFLSRYEPLGAFFQRCQSGHQAAFSAGGVILVNGPFGSRFVERFDSLDRGSFGFVQVAGFDRQKCFLDLGPGCAFINSVPGPVFFILPFSFL